VTTKDIEKVFGIKNFQPPRELKSDVEILNHVANCYQMTKLFEDTFGKETKKEDKNLP